MSKRFERTVVGSATSGLDGASFDESNEPRPRARGEATAPLGAGDRSDRADGGLESATAVDAIRSTARGGAETELHRRSLLAGAVSIAGLAGCLGSLGDSGDGGGGGGGDDEEAIEAVVRENARTMETEDLDAHMETIHPESPMYDRTERTMEQLFDRFDLRVEVDIESVAVDGDTAEAEVVQTTRATGDAAEDYADSRTRLTHELRTYEGDWKIYQTRLEDSEEI